MKLGVKCSAYDLIGAAPDGHVLVQVHTEAVFNSPKHICWVCVVEQTCTVCHKNMYMPSKMEEGWGLGMAD